MGFVQSEIDPPTQFVNSCPFYYEDFQCAGELLPPVKGKTTEIIQELCAAIVGGKEEDPNLAN